MLVLWVALAAISRNYPQSTTPESWLRIAEMTTLATLGLLASLKKWPLLMLAGLLKVSLFPAPQWNPPFIFTMITAFSVSALVWWLFTRGGEVTLPRGLIAGMLIGWLTPPLM
jgi:hypothetical protein